MDRRRLMLCLGAVFALTTLAAAPATAQDAPTRRPAPEPRWRRRRTWVQRRGDDVGRGARATGRAVGRGVRATGRVMARGGRAVARGTRRIVTGR